MCDAVNRTFWFVRTLIWFQSLSLLSNHTREHDLDSDDEAVEDYLNLHEEDSDSDQGYFEAGYANRFVH